MSFDKQYPNRKDWRRKLRGSKSVDRSCRNHGDCPYCRSKRCHKLRKAMTVEEDIAANEEDTNQKEN